MGIPAARGLLNFQGAPPLSIHLYDPDSVQLSNLHRQVLFTTADIGKPKAPLLAEKLNEIVPESLVKFRGHELAISRANIDTLAEAALIIDATDSVETKFLLNDFCVERKIPFLYGGAVGLHGQLLFTDPREPSCGCLRCLFADFTPEDMAAEGPTCRQAGILGPVAGYIGFRQAELAAAFLSGQLDLSKGAIFSRVNFKTGHTHDTAVRKNSDCPLHSSAAHTRVLDLTAKQCPSTFLYTKLALEQIGPAESLEVHFGNRDSALNVSASVAEEGYKVSRGPQEIDYGKWTVTITRAKNA